MKLNGWYIFTRSRQPGPGAQAYAVATYRLPTETSIGPGVNAGQIFPLQPPQFYQSQQLAWAGVGGVQAGQVMHQPLSDPSNGIPSSYLLS